MKKGQMNIDFVMSMSIFVTVFLIYTYNIAGVTSQHLENMRGFRFETDCLAISNALMDRLTGEGFMLNETYYSQVIDGCESPIPGSVSELKYIQLKNDLNAGEREINVMMTLFLIAPTTELTREGYYTGKLEYGGNIYSVDVFRSSTDSVFDRFNISGGDLAAPLLNRKEGDALSLGGNVFTVKRIDPDGNFVLFYRKIADCGIKPALEEKYARYSFFERRGGHVVRVDVICK